MSKTELCLTCWEKREYDVRTEIVKTRHKSVRFEYEEQRAFCRVCGHEVYVAELNDANVDAALTAYDRARGDEHGQRELNRRTKLLECRRELDKGMLATGSVDYAFQMDAKDLLWWLCNAVLLLIEKELKK